MISLLSFRVGSSKLNNSGSISINSNGSDVVVVGPVAYVRARARRTARVSKRNEISLLFIAHGLRNECFLNARGRYYLPFSGREARLKEEWINDRTENRISRLSIREGKAGYACVFLCARARVCIYLYVCMYPCSYIILPSV